MFNFCSPNGKNPSRAYGLLNGVGTALWPLSGTALARYNPISGRSGCRPLFHRWS